MSVGGGYVRRLSFSIKNFVLIVIVFILTCLVLIVHRVEWTVLRIGGGFCLFFFDVT